MILYLHKAALWRNKTTVSATFEARLGWLTTLPSTSGDLAWSCFSTNHCLNMRKLTSFSQRLMRDSDAFTSKWCLIISHAARVNSDPVKTTSVRHRIRLWNLESTTQRDTTARDQTFVTSKRSCLLQSQISTAWRCPAPDYAALSYCWRDGPADQLIYCDGCPIQITAALLDALCSLRKLTRMYLWVDQICVNQTDLKDCSSRVHLIMIYPN